MLTKLIKMFRAGSLVNMLGDWRGGFNLEPMASVLYDRAFFFKLESWLSGRRVAATIAGANSGEPVAGCHWQAALMSTASSLAP
jgi:hypothetical protein